MNIFWDHTFITEKHEKMNIVLKSSQKELKHIDVVEAVEDFLYIIKKDNQNLYIKPHKEV